jgi:hypothetical protein
MKMQAGQFARDLAGTITKTLPSGEHGLLRARIESGFFTIVENTSLIDDTLVLAIYKDKYNPTELSFIASQLHRASGLDTGFDLELEAIFVSLNPHAEIKTIRGPG